jgi:hypothetical protein
MGQIAVVELYNLLCGTSLDHNPDKVFFNKKLYPYCQYMILSHFGIHSHMGNNTF